MLLAAASGCFDPAYEDCSVACTSNEDCAPGHACTAAGVCAGGDDPMVCGAPEPEPAASPIGMFNLTLTDQENGCAFPDWDPAMTSRVDLKISESSNNLVGEPQGTMANILQGWLGTKTFKGPKAGLKVQLQLTGKRYSTQQGCDYTFDVTLDTTLSGDRLEGSLYYRSRTNETTTCSSRSGCTSRQALTGTRASM